MRIAYHGNPKRYETFIDETLNNTLRLAAAHAHRSTFHKRIALTFHHIGALGLNDHLYSFVDVVPV